ncbi:MAG: PASTA domain-containing protein [Coriobacteriales bacterium]|jgi:serine/threonine-protein kinase|nr:PASTA domain-containing protein [Coriobacteriales bacterium]
MGDFLSQFEGDGVKPVVAQRAAPGSDVGAAPDGAAPAGGAAPASAPTGTVEPGHDGLFVPVTPVAPASSAYGIRSLDHRVEVDKGYRRKRLVRAVVVMGAVVVFAALAFLAWYLMRLVEVPELVGKQVAEAQSFSNDSGIGLDLAEEYRLAEEEGTVLSQSVPAGEKLSKGSVLALAVSKGPDPDEALALPDFATLKRAAAEAWIQDMRADNLRLVQEYSDTVADGDFLRIEFRGNDVDAARYRRRDYATLYYSQGAEVFEKNITVPDFAGKMRSEVETWAQTNSLVLTVEEADSDTVEEGGVVSQSVAAGEKLAKKDAFSVTVSLGKAIIVPDFSAYTAETASAAAEGLPLVIETRFHPSVAYGRFVSQSLAAGTRLLPGDEATLTVTYSEGLPYLRDYRGTSEGDLPAAFFNDFATKGANVTYELRYVDSSESKGTVVAMDDHSRFIPLEFHVVIDVSKGNLKPPVDAGDGEDADTGTKTGTGTDASTKTGDDVGTGTKTGTGTDTGTKTGDDADADAGAKTPTKSTTKTDTKAKAA